MKTLTEIYNQRTVGFVSDKWSSYLLQYHRIFEKYVNKPVTVLEVGVQNGGSLEILSEYFSPESLIIGCDINEKCRNTNFSSNRIKLVIGDVSNASTINEILSHSTEFDIIIDDGSHKSEDIISTFGLLFPRLKDGGVYLCEDLHASYWYKFSGGLFHPKSSILFFKSLVDIINFEHWGVKTEAASYLTHIGFNLGIESNSWLPHIHSIEFVNSVCILRKENSPANKLGKRVISGDIEFLSSNKKYHGTQNVAQDQSENPYSKLEKSLAPRAENINKELQKVTTLAASQHVFYSQLISSQFDQIRQLQNELLRAEAQLDLLKDILLQNDQIDGI